jgi:hypothetical protein
VDVLIYSTNDKKTLEERLEFLLFKGLKLDQQSINRLFTGFKLNKDYRDITRWLLNKGFRPDQTVINNHFSETLMFGEYREQINFLLSENMKPDQDGINDLFLSSVMFGNCQEQIKFLVEKGFRPDENHVQQILDLAAKYQDEGFEQFLKSAIAKPLDGAPLDIQSKSQMVPTDSSSIGKPCAKLVSEKAASAKIPSIRVLFPIIKLGNETKSPEAKHGKTKELRLASACSGNSLTDGSGPVTNTWQNAQKTSQIIQKMFVSGSKGSLTSKTSSGTPEAKDKSPKPFIPTPGIKTPGIKTPGTKILGTKTSGALKLGWGEKLFSSPIKKATPENATPEKLAGKNSIRDIYKINHFEALSTEEELPSPKEDQPKVQADPFLALKEKMLPLMGKSWADYSDSDEEG